ncbi:hypothetical protein EJ07DRAFT_151513 [Lizonia empirigonia]|nr:hypothetical protein EJ07DRAFT_151513 [Lizonia empirigonia]
MFLIRAQRDTPAISSRPKQSIAGYHTQAQSPFFRRLPAEVRKEIYVLVFAAENIPTTAAVAAAAASSSPQPPSHPLSLLLPCRQIHHESASPAFLTYTFRLPARAATYILLRARASPLPPRTASPSAPSARRTAAAPAPYSPTRCSYSPDYDTSRCTSRARATATHDDVHAQAVQRYAPFWVQRRVERAVTGGAEYAWQAGERWGAWWAQGKSELCYSLVEAGERGLRGGVAYGLRCYWVGSRGAGVCGQVSWTAVTLVQEGGRRVDVEALYLGEPWTSEKCVPEKCVPNVLLVPGTEPAAGVVVHEAGLGFSPEEEYWEAMRRRNGNLGAVCRGLWEKAMRPVSIVGLSTADSQAGAAPTGENEKL